MSAIGELFVEELQNLASDNGLIQLDYEVLEIEEGMYELWDVKYLPTIGRVPIMGESDEEEFLEYELVLTVDEDGDVTYNILKISRDGKEVILQPSGQVDYIEYLKPIINDLKDGEDKLFKEDVDYLMPILRAKIELHEGLITREEYDEIMGEG